VSGNKPNHQRSETSLSIVWLKNLQLIQEGTHELKTGEASGTPWPGSYTLIDGMLTVENLIVYFDLAARSDGLHFIGEPQETRHIWIEKSSGLCSIPTRWSGHSGAGY